MKWIEVKAINGKLDLNTLPKISGKYLITTKTNKGNINRFDSYFDGHKFHFSNQILLSWLSE